MNTARVLLIVALTTACASPPGPPQEIATRIVTDLDAGRVDDADALYQRVSSDASYRDRIYPVLYQTAADRYREGSTSTTVPLLRFLTEHFPDSAAAQEALLYTLFVERGRTATADADIVDEIQRTLASLADSDSEAPVWAEMIRTQQAIDRDEIDSARNSFRKFKAAWDGEPASLAIYVDDLERYLNSR